MGPEEQPVASECQERNGSVGAGGVLLLRSLASEQSLEDQRLVRIWAMILGWVTSSGSRGGKLALGILCSRMPRFC